MSKNIEQMLAEKIEKKLSSEGTPRPNAYEIEKNKEYKRIAVKLPFDEHRDFKIKCMTIGENMDNVLRQLILNFLEGEK